MMNPHPCTRRHQRLTGLTYVVALAFVMLLAVAPSHAQSITRIAGPHVAAHVQTTPRSGRFWITSGYLSRDSLQLLFGSPTQITSTVVFRVERQGSVLYYCNAPEDGEPRPSDPMTGDVAFRPFDALRCTDDTLELEWRDIGGFDITMRFVPDQDAWPFVSGGDMLVEFEHRLRTGAPAATLGILMMLDLYNNDRANAGSEDRAEILSETSYHVPGELPIVHTEPVPSWYLFGRFTPKPPLSRFFGIHRLGGTARSGAMLTPPELVAFNRWASLREVAWDLTGPDGPFFDAAAIVRWGGLRGTGIVRTAFGLNDSLGNDFSFGYSPRTFATLRTGAIIRRDPIEPGSVRDLFVDAWAINPVGIGGEMRSFRLLVGHDDRWFMPAWLRLVSVEEVDAWIYRTEPRHLRWHYQIIGGIRDTTLTFRLQMRTETQPWDDLDHGGFATLRILGHDAEPPLDRVAPLLLRVDSTASPERSWTLRTRDRAQRGPQAGIDSIAVHSVGHDTLVNARLFLEPPTWRPCDSTTVTLRVSVIDSSLPASIVIAVVDCHGNAVADTVRYDPVPSAAPMESISVGQGRGRVVPQPCGGDCASAMLELVDVGACDGRLHIITSDGRRIAGRVVTREEMGGGRLAIGALTADLASGFYVAELVSDCATVRSGFLITH